MTNYFSTHPPTPSTKVEIFLASTLAVGHSGGVVVAGAFVPAAAAGVVIINVKAVGETVVVVGVTAFGAFFGRAALFTVAALVVAVVAGVVVATTSCSGRT